MDAGDVLLKIEKCLFEHEGRECECLQACEQAFKDAATAEREHIAREIETLLRVKSMVHIGDVLRVVKGEA